jgi:hypothetical protein
MNPQLNKKVKKYLDSYFRDTKTNSPEHQEAVMLILRGALTDANFHSEAKQLGKYFPKASKKYIGTPMEGVIEDKGVDIAKMAKWDGHDIIDAFAFYLSMSIGGSFGNRLMSLKESLEESLVSEGERLDEKNCPTNPSKWSYYKSQAKKKFDVYPSAYANGWASKQYKAAGGGWKSCKKESVDEGMVTPRRGHNYYQLYRDTPIKYVSGHSGIGLEVPGVLLHNEYDTIKGKKGAYIIDYFGAHFYVDMKNKFASRIAHPDNREQNKDLRKNMGRTALAPEHKDWKKYVRESVNELNVKTYRSAFQKAMDRGDDKGREIARRAIDLLGREIAKELKNTSLVVKPSDIKSFHNKYFGGKPPMTGQYEIKFNGKGTLHKPDLNLDTKDITLFVKGEVGQAKEYGGWDGPIELDRYIGWKPVTLQLSIRNGSVEVYPYGGGGQLQFSRQGARLLAAYAKSMNIAMGGDGKVKHNAIKQFTPHKNESVNEASVGDFEIGDFVHFKSKNKSGMVVSVKGNKVTINTPKGKITSDVKDVKVLHQDNVNEAASRTAMEIGGLTGLNKDAIQKFVDDNKLDIEKVYQFVKKGKLADRMKLVSAIAGKPNNPVQKKMIKQFGEGIIKEAKVRLGKDSVNFKVMGDSKGLTLIAASGNDLDGLQAAIENDVDVKEELRKTLEKQLKVPVEVDRGYDGAGFRFNIDFYSLAKKVK